MFAYDSTLNAGRFSADHYTLDRLLAMRQSLLTGVLPSFPVTVIPQAGTLAQACAVVSAAVKANVSETGKIKAIEGVPGQTVLDTLARMATETTTHSVVDGNTRNLACVLHAAIGSGEPIQLYTVQVLPGQDNRVMSFRGNAAQELAAKTDWKTRTAAVVELLDNRKGNASEKDLMEVLNLKRGTAQHAMASAVAVRVHGLDLGRCVSMDKEQWRKVRDCATKEEAEKLAYTAGTVEKQWSPRLVCQRLLETGYQGMIPEIIEAIANGTEEDFLALT